MKSSFRRPREGVQSNWCRRRSCSRSRSFAVIVPILVVAIGCSGDATPPASAPVPEAYPGVISPVDVGAQAAPPSDLDGRALAALPPQKKVEHLVAKHGVASVVAMSVEGLPPKGAPQLVQVLMRAADSNAGCFTHGNAGRTVVYMAPVTDLEGFAGRLDIGEVTVDSEKRVILVKIDETKLAEALRPRTTHLGDLASPKRERPGATAAPTSELRTWADNTGEHKIEATFVSFQDGQVTLKRSDGSTITLPFDRLSVADQEVVKKMAAKP